MRLLTCHLVLAARLALLQNPEQLARGPRRQTCQRIHAPVSADALSHAACAEHCESLAAAGLTIGENADVEAIDCARDQVAGVLEDVLLRISLVVAAREDGAEFPGLCGVA